MTFRLNPPTIGRVRLQVECHLRSATADHQSGPKPIDSRFFAVQV
jgi:hypothetical protein